MARKLACRAARLWPDVIADLIGEYAEYTREEKLWVLIRRTLPGDIVMFLGGFEMMRGSGKSYGLIFGRSLNHNVCNGVNASAFVYDLMKNVWPFHPSQPPLAPVIVAQLDVQLSVIE